MARRGKKRGHKSGKTVFRTVARYASNGLLAAPFWWPLLDTAVAAQRKVPMEEVKATLMNSGVGYNPQTGSFDNVGAVVTRDGVFIAAGLVGRWLSKRIR